MSFPTGFAPDRSGTGHARCGRDRSSTTWSYVFDMRRTSSTSSLTQCDLASQHTAQAGHNDGSNTNRRERPSPLPPYPLTRVRWSVHSVTGASNVSVGSGICVGFGSQAHLSMSAPSRTGPGLLHPVSGQLSTRHPVEIPGRATCGFLLLFSCRHSLLGHPLPPGLPPPLLSAYRRRAAFAVPSRTHDAGFPRCARVRYGPGGALSVSRGRRCSSAIGASVAVACRFSTASPCHPGAATQPGMFQ